MDRLIVKNFGPLKDIDIELNKINLFIGENGSGKSVLGKLITILYNVFDNMNSDIDDIIKSFDEYKINYISKDTIIELSGKLDNNEKEILISIKNLDIKFGKLIDDFKDKYTELIDINISQQEQIDTINKKLSEINKLKKISNDNDELLQIEEELKNLLDEIKNHDIFNRTNEVIRKFNKMQTRYIPSERNFVSIISQSLSSFIVADIPLPKFFLQFSSDFENGANKLKELKVLNVHYKYGEGLDRHKVYFDEKNYLPLNESSSGIQAVIPLLVTYKYFTQKYNTIVIEEPEQNLFPKAQAEILKYIIEQKSDNNNLFMMTHSPYVLSTLNNLIFAFKVAQKGEETKEKVKDLIKEEQWISPDDFSAYYLENGVAKNIVSKRGLISDNAIDDISEDVTGEFDDLMQIYREFKYAK